jgi:tRNA (uracil-5-)-methyltransferase TRM9
MNEETSRQLLALNRAFYAAVAEPFNQTRYAESPGKARLLHCLAEFNAHDPLRVLDVGCGNGRLAWMLERLNRPVQYTGVDAEAQLLALAAQNTRTLHHVQTGWLQADLTDPTWHTRLAHPYAPPYDVAVCLATLQHLPGFKLRAKILADLAKLTASTGRVVVSAWQFLTSERLAAKQLPWAEAEIDPAQVEPGDALLPWQQGQYAVRYVHQIDQAELERLAASAQLTIDTIFYADGKEGNLNLYAIMQHKAD